MMILYEIAYWVGIIGVLASAAGVVVAIWLILQGEERKNEKEERLVMKQSEDGQIQLQPESPTMVEKEGIFVISAEPFDDFTNIVREERELRMSELLQRMGVDAFNDRQGKPSPKGRRPPRGYEALKRTELQLNPRIAQRSKKA